MKRIVLAVSLLLVPISLAVSAWQAYSYHTLEEELDHLEQEQQTAFERNKRFIAQYSVESSPGLIEARAKAELNMARPRQDQILKPELEDSLNDGN